MTTISGIKTIDIIELNESNYSVVLDELSNLKTESKILDKQYYDKEESRSIMFSILTTDGNTVIFNEGASLIKITDDNGEVFTFITNKDFKHAFSKL